MESQINLNKNNDNKEVNVRDETTPAQRQGDQATITEAIGSSLTQGVLSEAEIAEFGHPRVCLTRLDFPAIPPPKPQARKAKTIRRNRKTDPGYKAVRRAVRSQLQANSKSEDDLDAEMRSTTSDTQSDIPELKGFKEFTKTIDSVIQRRLSQEFQQPQLQQQQLQKQETDEEGKIPESSESSGKRSRGRPPHDKEENEKRKEREKKKAEEAELQWEREIMDPLKIPELKGSFKAFLKQITSKEQEFHNAPIRDLEALVAEKGTAIFKVMVQSGNLKGTFIKHVKEAAADMCAAATTLAIRAQNPNEVSFSEQLAELRRQVQFLSNENNELRQMIEKGHKKEHGTHKNEISQPLREENTLLEVKSGRTKEWVKETSPLFPSTSGGLSRPPVGKSGIMTTLPQIEAMEVEELDSTEYHKRTAKHTRNPTSVTPKYEEEALVAKIEGIFERLMDKRFECPVPTYSQTKAAARVAQNSAPTKKETTSALPIKAKTQRGKQTNPVQSRPTTLNPPANPAKPRIVSVEKVSPPLVVTGKKRGKNNGAPAIEQTPAPIRCDTRQSDAGKQSWAVVASRKRGAANQTVKRTSEGGETNRGAANKRSAPLPVKPITKPDPVKVRRVPRMAAITITCPPGTYEATMREARKKINLEGLGIQGVRIRRAITGALLYEIPGEKSHEMADTLAQKLRRALSNKEGVRIHRPTKMAELRIRGLDESASPLEIREAIAALGNCVQEDVTVGDVKRSSNGTDMAWVRCPLTAANQLSLKGQIKVGWALARVDLLENRPLQCYKCLEGGHVRARCPNNVDRSGKCYRCGQEGHIARECTAPISCTLCRERGLPFNHRTGGGSCAPVRKGKRGVPFDKMRGLQSFDKIQTDTVASGETVEPPKEQRIIKERTKRPEGEEDEPSEGGCKRQRIRETLSPDPLDAMELALEGEEASTVQDGK